MTNFKTPKKQPQPKRSGVFEGFSIKRSNYKTHPKEKANLMALIIYEIRLLVGCPSSSAHRLNEKPPMECKTVWEEEQKEAFAKIHSSITHVKRLCILQQQLLSAFFPFPLFLVETLVFDSTMHYSLVYNI